MQMKKLPITKKELKVGMKVLLNLKEYKMSGHMTPMIL